MQPVATGLEVLETDYFSSSFRLGYSVNGVEQTPLPQRYVGHLPIMLRSSACNLHGLSPEELIRRGEQETEWGGYFVIGGHERLIR